MIKFVLALIVGVLVTGQVLAAEQGAPGSSAGQQAAEESSGDATLLGVGALVAGAIGAVLNAAAGDDANPTTATSSTPSTQ